MDARQTLVMTINFLQMFKPSRQSPSVLKLISYKVFLFPVVMMIVGGLIWVITTVLAPTNLPLILLGQIIFTIGMFVAIILGFWVMTIVRMPRR
ncbi:MAG: hypothetical protein ACFFD8_06120 [Candidatus Thorarchaeota archaeon]